MATIKGGKGVKALAVIEDGGKLCPHEIGRPEPGPNDVQIKIHFCGMCHSDVHATNGDWGFNLYPMAPGHEIAGTVIKSNSAKFKEGQRVGVGCMVDSCKSCDLCSDGIENHCPEMIQTYSSQFPKGHDHDDCAEYHTNGGYSEEIVVHDRFVFGIPDKLKLAHAGPLLCAGVTTYSPLNKFVKGKKNQRVGVIGFGGLGMMTVKLAKAMGASVTVFSRSLNKKEAAEALGADLVSHQDADAMGACARTLDTIIDTLPTHHEVSSLIGCLKVGGQFCFLGGVPKPYEINAFQLLFGGYNVCGSLIGGTTETKEMLEFCAENNIVPEIEIIPASKAAKSFDDMVAGKSQAKRSVIDMATLAELF